MSRTHYNVWFVNCLITNKYNGIQDYIRRYIIHFTRYSFSADREIVALNCV